ncbi:DUF4402 domain-containing protein [Flavobacterium frigoris]|uniref:DUF4402 domain-containing protein n=1 Tax=Flavobacterium frigoris TaxID=229204 RepID=UPI0006804405|nr:DUF4402 domain-containing protein [Flavobacterium frigoris]
MKIVNSKRPFHTLKIFIAALLFGASYSYGQPSLPTRSIEVTATQALQFGTFALTGAAGGSVVVGYDGSRAATGSIAILGISPYAQPAIFEVKLLQGRNVHLDFSPTTTLQGSDGGSLILHIGPTEKGTNGAFFSTNNNREFTTLLRVGGTLDIPGNAIPGTYTGTFFITFNQE